MTGNPTRLTDGFWVGDFFVDPMGNRLVRDGQEVPIEPKVMGVLLCLAEQPGKTVARDDFLERVWEGMVVGDDVLSRCISELRRALDDDTQEARYIETIRKVGYRLVAPVTPVGPGGMQEPEFRSNWSDSRVSPGSQRSDSDAASAATSPPISRLERWIPLGLALVVVVALVYSLANRDSGPFRPNTQPLTRLPGLEIDPAFSPDGMYIAFASDEARGTDFDIFVRHSEDEVVRQITNDTSDDRFPAWSPDGSTLAFVRMQVDGSTVYTVPSLGGPEQPVVELGNRQVQGVSWSPDGRRLAISIQRQPFGPFGIFVVDLDTAGVRQITLPPKSSHGDTWPTFSPDGSSIAFARGPNRSLKDVYLVSLDGPPEVDRMTYDSMDVEGIDWVPDGRGILLAANRGGANGIWQVEFGDTTATFTPVLTAEAGQTLEQPTVDRKGGRFSFVQHNQVANIWRVSRSEDGSPVTVPVVRSSHFDSYPSLSPSGKALAFASTRSGQQEIWMSSIDGSEPRQLTTGFSHARSPAWSPDGSQLVFQARKWGNADLFLLSPGSGPPRRLTVSRADDIAPSWSHDGEAIYFSSDRTGEWQLWRIGVRDELLEQVTFVGVRSGRESSDGEHVYIVRTDTVGIWMRSSRPGPDTPELVFPDLHSLDWGNWEVAADGIFYVERENLECSLSFFPFGGQGPKRLAHLGVVPDHPSLAVGADESTLVFTRFDDERSRIMMADRYEE